MKGIEWGEVDKVPLKNDTVIIIGGGRSLSHFDFERLRDVAHLIAVNDSGKLVRFADSWFTLDPWGLEGPQLPPMAFSGRLFAAVGDDYGTNYARSENHRVTPQRKITFLHRLMSNNHVGVSSELAYRLGLSEDRGCISTGNSGYGALNLAYHLRPKKIVLLGLDGDIGYYYTKDKTNRKLTYLPAMFDSTKQQIEAAGIEVLNGSIKSTITTYPRMSINDALRDLHAS